MKKPTPETVELLIETPDGVIKIAKDFNAEAIYKIYFDDFDKNKPLKWYEISQPLYSYLKKELGVMKNDEEIIYDDNHF